MLTGEMSPHEGVLAAQWLGLETVLPCHYIDPENGDVLEFMRGLDAAQARGEDVPQARVLRPGEIISVEGRPEQDTPLQSSPWEERGFKPLSSQGRALERPANCSGHYLDLIRRRDYACSNYGCAAYHACRRVGDARARP